MREEATAEGKEVRTHRDLHRNGESGQGPAALSHPWSHNCPRPLFTAGRAEPRKVKGQSQLSSDPLTRNSAILMKWLCLDFWETEGIEKEAEFKS